MNGTQRPDSGLKVGTTEFASDVAAVVGLSPRAEGVAFRALLAAPQFNNFCDTVGGVRRCLSDDDVRHMTTLHEGVTLHPTFDLQHCPAGHAINVTRDPQTDKVCVVLHAAACLGVGDPDICPSQRAQLMGLGG